jgi:hypothetical protein
MRTILIPLAIIASLWSAPLDIACSASDYTNWSREVLQIPTGSDNQKKSFYVGVVTGIDDQLVILCKFQNTDLKESKHVHGRKDEDGNFWPVVSYRVSVPGSSEWRDIGTAQNSSSVDDVAVPPGDTITLHISAIPFRPFVGTSRLGRLDLDGGASAVFLLEDLLPPADRLGSGRDFKEELEHVEQPRFESSALLYSITFFDGVLTGDFLGVDSGSSVLKGTRTPEGDFWPSVSFFVGESNEDWHNIGTSSGPGETSQLNHSDNKHSPLLLRVKLDAFRPRLGQNKYGKIIFSDGSFAVFLIDHLNPRGAPR